MDGRGKFEKLETRDADGKVERPKVIPAVA
jgi:hypothetical protein